MHFLPSNSIFVDFFGAETQASAGAELAKIIGKDKSFELFNYDPHLADCKNTAYRRFPNLLYGRFSNRQGVETARR
jgi:hypothetical protein